MEAETFEQRVLIQQDRLTRAIEVLGKEVDKISHTIYGNGDVKGSVIWRQQEILDSVDSLKKGYEELKKIADDAKKEREVLKEKAEKQEKESANLDYVNVFLGYFRSKWFTAGFFLVAFAVVYAIGLIAVHVPFSELVGWVWRIISKFFG